MLSATYRQSSKPRAQEMEADPTNQLLWRMNPRRMDIEAYRDSLLQASGKLDLDDVRALGARRRRGRRGGRCTRPSAAAAATTS